MFRDDNRSRSSRERLTWEFREGDPIAPPQVDGRSILKSIGGGSAYEVFLVWDERLHAICVAKVLRPDRATDERSLDELREEAEILERVSHPVIVRGFDAVLHGPHPHLLIEHLEGPSLRRLIKRDGALPLQQVLPLALHLAGALHYMAGEGLVHLDVKPDNIIMGVPPRLIDLSIARTTGQAAATTRPLGTDAYMPPEQCDPAAHPGSIGPASDVWGLGATLHHAVGGSKPFPRLHEVGRDEDEDRYPQLHEEPEPLPEWVPGELAILVASMLEHEPAERPTAAEVAARLEPLIAELPSKMSLSRSRSPI